MKNYIFTVFTILISLNLMAQHDIKGVYKRSSGSPEGRNTFFVMENNKFAVAFFGGVLVGNWQIKDNLVTFTPDVDEHHFYIFGRHNKDLKNETRICFQSFQEQSTFIGFGKNQGEIPLLKRVFNPSPNCVKYPSVSNFKGTLTNILFSDQNFDFAGAQSDGNSDRNIYTFENKEKYNDFIAYYKKDDREKEPFFARLKDGKLFFKYDKDEGSTKYPLPTSGEDFEFIKQIVNAPRFTEKINVNPFYKLSNEDVNDTDNWKFNTKKNAFVNLFNYTEGEEYKPKAQNAYNNMNIIYQFNNLPLTNKTIKPFAVDTIPLFTATCNK